MMRIFIRSICTVVHLVTFLFFRVASAIVVTFKFTIVACSLSRTCKDTVLTRHKHQEQTHGTKYCSFQERHCFFYRRFIEDNNCLRRLQLIIIISKTTSYKSLSMATEARLMHIEYTFREVFLKFDGRVI